MLHAIQRLGLFIKNCVRHVLQLNARQQQLTTASSLSPVPWQATHVTSRRCRTNVSTKSRRSSISSGVVSFVPRASRNLVGFEPVWGGGIPVLCCSSVSPSITSAVCWLELMLSEEDDALPALPRVVVRLSLLSRNCECREVDVLVDCWVGYPFCSRAARFPERSSLSLSSSGVCDLVLLCDWAWLCSFEDTGTLLSLICFGPSIPPVTWWLAILDDRPLLSRNAGWVSEVKFLLPPSLVLRVSWFLCCVCSWIEALSTSVMLSPNDPSWRITKTGLSCAFTY